MKEVAVYYADTLWGTLLETEDRKIYFEYSKEALESKIELSPLKCKLSSGVTTNYPEHQFRLPGFIYDCLPDGWGMLLMDKMFEKNNITYVSPLDRLTYSNANTIGALRFEPIKKNIEEKIVDLLEVSKHSKEVYADTANKNQLLSLIQYGGSAHGARPKMLLFYDGKTVTNKEQEGFTPWIFKFQSTNDNKESIGVEQMYMEIAKDCDLDVMPTKYINLDSENSCFATERFDYLEGKKLHVHTLAGLTHANFRTPGNIDYSMYLKAVNFLTRSHVQLQKAYRYCVFNCIFNNLDDHPKNFSFLFDGKNWTVSPAYDLTFIAGKERHMDVNGRGSKIGNKDLLEMAKGFGIKNAEEIINKIAYHAINFEKRYTDNKYSVKSSSIKQIQKQLKENVLLMYNEQKHGALLKVK